jgi:RTX calcium-binding nonapeptide repeat (4 copies)
VGGVSQTVTRNANTGFEALKSLDANNDRVFNASDTAFTQVRLWQDLNQDGISQTGELATLAAKGIASIALVPTDTTTNLNNGNTVTGQAVVKRTNGSSTQIDSVDLQASNLDLANNPFYREFTDRISLTDAAKALPEMGGSGVLRDLRQAMSLGTPAAATLTAAVQTFANASTGDAQLAALDNLLLAWAQTGPDLEAGLRRTTGNWVQIATSNGGDTGQAAFEAAIGQALDAKGLQWRSLLSQADFRPGCGNTATTQLLQMAQDAGVITGSTSATFGNNGIQTTYLGIPLYSGLPSLSGNLQRIGVLEAFNGSVLLPSLVMLGGSVGSQLQSFAFGLPGSAAQAAVEQAYAALRESVYGALVPQTRLKPYLDAVQLVIDEDGIRFDASPISAALQTKAATDPYNAILDLLDLQKYESQQMAAVGWQPFQALADMLPTLTLTPAIQSLLSSRHIVTLSPTEASFQVVDVAGSTVVGNKDSNTLRGGSGVDRLSGVNGNDTLTASGNHDMLDGGAGDDVLNADVYGGNTTLIGGTGNDTLTGPSGPMPRSTPGR